MVAFLRMKLHTPDVFVSEGRDEIISVIGLRNNISLPFTTDVVRVYEIEPGFFQLTEQAIIRLNFHAVPSHVRDFKGALV